MNIKRYMVTGKRLDNGEPVTGFYLELNGEKMGERSIRSCILDNIGRTLDIDFATVEPVAVPVVLERSLLGYYCCPNCRKVLYVAAMGRTNYCPSCGQRLDWGEV
ncbi:MAG: hypothetical protein LBR72_08470 [Oscillospiraceae bacterium]|jgi:ssDNA-binding Zn-finger/Zn-ribbon topoisomerase 1|nr:hypothetical protein [Oscillospiraceae bacterium]